MRLYTRQTGEAAGSTATSAAAWPLEDSIMAGYVRAHVQIHADRSFDVEPSFCPGADDHTAGQARCFTQHADGWTRSCVYYLTTCKNDNVTERVHPTALCDQTRWMLAHQVRCGVICLRQRGNRPPGC